VARAVRVPLSWRHLALSRPRHARASNATKGRPHTLGMPRAPVGVLTLASIHLPRTRNHKPSWLDSALRSTPTREPAYTTHMHAPQPLPRTHRATAQPRRQCKPPSVAEIRQVIVDLGASPTSPLLLLAATSALRLPSGGRLARGVVVALKVALKLWARRRVPLWLAYLGLKILK